MINKYKTHLLYLLNGCLVYNENERISWTDLFSYKDVIVNTLYSSNSINLTKKSIFSSSISNSN
jgi:hypothetical protein